MKKYLVPKDTEYVRAKFARGNPKGEWEDLIGLDYQMRSKREVVFDENDKPNVMIAYAIQSAFESDGMEHKTRGSTWFYFLVHGEAGAMIVPACWVTIIEVEPKTR